MRKFSHVAICALLFALLANPITILASNISNALYSGTVIISNNSIANTNVATVANISTQNLIAGGYLNSTANNTVMRNSSGADVPFMPAYSPSSDFWCMFVPSIGANSYLTYILYTANSSGGEIRYFSNTGGMTVGSDNASMEPTDNFSLEIKGWIDTTTSNNSIIYKQDAFRTWVNASGNISATIWGDVSITPADNQGGGANSEVRNTNAVYLTAHDAAVGTAVNAPITIGQTPPGAAFTISRGGVWFDTSGIPDDAVITHAVLHLRGTLDNSVDDFNIVIQNGQPAYPSEPLVVADYDYNFYSGNGGSLTTVGFNPAGDNPITLSATGLTWINKAGTTKFILRSDEDINSSQPANNEAVSGSTANTYLEVFYTELTASGITSGEYTVTTSIKDDPGLLAYDSSVDIGVSMGSGILPVRILEEQTLTAPAASVTFSGITGNVSLWDTLAGVTSRHLVVIVNAKSPDAIALRLVYMRFNGDNGNNYNRQELYGSDVVANAVAQTGTTSNWVSSMLGTTYLDAFGGGVTIIPHAFNTSNHKSSLSIHGAAERRIATTAGRWADTSAVESINLFPNVGNFDTGSTFLLGVIDERYLVEEAINLAADFVVDFNNITGTGHDLVVVGYFRSDRPGIADNLKHEINTDAVAANYARQWLQGSGAVSSAAQANDMMISRGPANTAGANQFGSIVASYSQYAEGANDPHFLSLTGYHTSVGPSSEVYAFSGRWDNAATPPITRLEYYPQVGANFKAGSLFSLYRVPRYVIDRQELTAGAATITFNNIPQNYQALQLNVYARGNVAALTDTVSIEINADAVAANYDFQELEGTGAGPPTAARNAASQTIMLIPAANEGANEFGGGVVTFPIYTRTDGHKHWITLSGTQENQVILRSSRWESNSAITQIILDLPGAQQFVTGSVFELVGLMPTVAFMLEIDGEVEGIEAASTASVVDNNSDWIVGGDATPYIEYFTESVGGNPVCEIEWEYDSVFHDQVLDNDATPTFRTASSDPDVTANLTSFQPISQAQAPAYALGPGNPFLSDTSGNVTGNFTTAPLPPGVFPLAGVITAIANATATPPQLPLLIIACFVILAASLTTSYTMRRFGSGSLIIKAFVIIGIMGIFIGIGDFGIDFWMLVVFAIMATALAMMSRQATWQ